MSIDRSLKLKDALVRHRNVLTRAERIDRLKDEDKWEDDRSVLGLPKVSHRKARAKKAEKKEVAAEGAVGVEGAVAATPGAEPAAAGKAAPGAAKGAPAKAGAAPAAKAAAPAGKPAKEVKKK
ncbi:MAG: small basic protein [Sedimentisphaerales bacterium]|jgi:small basic protein (TIGR04137 family)